MIRKLQTKPFYLLLLPLFFLLHACQEQYGLIHLKSALLWLGSYYLMIAVTYGISYFISRDHKKASLITILWMSFFFFFSAFHHFFKTHAPFPLFGRYIFVLPLSIAILILLFIYVKKTPARFQKFSVMLNTLLILYLLLDISLLIWKSKNPEKYKVSLFEFPEIEQASICDTCNKPDIYFLLFDEYSGYKTLKEKYGFENELNNYLTEKGFQIQTDSRSNYNSTGFSMSSILNMAYLKGFRNQKEVTTNDYMACNDLIKNNRVTSFLKRNGYEIINYSIFDLDNKPSLTRQYFLPQIERVIKERTFFNRVLADIGLEQSPAGVSQHPKNPFQNQLQNLAYFQSLFKETTRKRPGSPRFVYLHLFLPHSPFFFDRLGRWREKKIVFSEDDYNNPLSYLQYVEYTNHFIKDIVDPILINNPNAVIVLMSDHGYRPTTRDPYPLDYFSNLNAVYYPDKDYKLLYKDISGCNQFRAIFNKLFNQNFPFLKDSTILVIDKK
jgi:Sulfatase